MDKEGDVRGKRKVHCFFGHKITAYNYLRVEFNYFRVVYLLIGQLVRFIPHFLIRLVTQAACHIISSYWLFK